MDIGMELILLAYLKVFDEISGEITYPHSPEQEEEIDYAVGVNDLLREEQGERGDDVYPEVELEVILGNSFAVHDENPLLVEPRVEVDEDIENEGEPGDSVHDEILEAVGLEAEVEGELEGDDYDLENNLD